MADEYLRIREKVNAKEWQVKKEPGVHQGNTVNNYFNQYVEEDRSSDSPSEESVLPKVQTTSTRRRPRSHPQIPSRSAGNPQRPGVRQQRITLAAKQDNAAKIAFRNNKPPDKILDMGKAIKDIQPNVASVSRILEEIGVRVGSFILPQRSLGESKLLIWGNQKQVAMSIVELKQWRHSATARAAPKERPLSKTNFATHKSPIGEHWAADERTARRDAVKEYFQRAPEQGQQFKFNGYFLWPNDEVRATDLFGPSCEALDPLRMEFKVHIVFDEARSVFKVYSNSSVDKIYDVIQRIENTIKEFVARDDRPLTLYLVEPPIINDYRVGVQMIPGPLIGPSRTPSKIPDACGSKILPIDVVDYELEAAESALQNQVRMSTAIEKTLERIPYYRGHLRMRAQFGTFTLVKFQWPPGVPSVALKKFESDVQSAGTRGTLIRDLQLNRPAEAILDQIYHANSLFQAIGTGDESLVEVPPQYTAMFHLCHPEKTEDNIRLEVEFKENTADTGFEASKALWMKGLKPDGVAQAAPLDIYNIRLHRLSAISWQLKISADNLVDPSRITPRMDAFANGVEFKQPPLDQYPALHGYRIFTSPSDFPVLGIEQKTTFRYCLKAQPKFIIEISRYDEYNDDKSWLPSSTNWAASFYDREWDSKLSENAKLGVGNSASWNPHANPFFEPINSSNKKPDAGFKDFLLHTQTIGKFLDELKMGPQGPSKAKNDSGENGESVGGVKEGQHDQLF
ncbi:MAG: hypothetical protein Q9209_003341 [Squamulea sp. 1 TL-2023]